MSAAVVAILATRKKYIRNFKIAGATSVQTAIKPEDHGIKKGIVFNGLVRQGMVKDAGGGKYYLDLEKETLSAVNRRTALIILLATILLIFLIALAITFTRK
jgi:hypothetical protein